MFLLSLVWTRLLSLDDYDYVLFDSTHVVIIPAKTEYLGFGEIGPVLDRLKSTQKAVVIPTMYDARETVQQGPLVSIQQRWPGYVISNGGGLPLAAQRPVAERGTMSGSID